MAKSSTKRKYRTKPAPEQVEQIETGVDRAVKYIASWQRQELLSLALSQKTGDLPVCVPIKKDTYIVGKCGLKRSGKLWEVTSPYNQESLHFSRKVTALIYLLCVQTKYPKLAKEILHHDREIIRLVEELEYYNYSLEKSKRKQDWWKVDHYTNRSSNVEFKLLEARNQLEKSIDLAKYFKIWDNKI